MAMKMMKARLAAAATDGLFTRAATKLNFLGFSPTFDQLPTPPEDIFLLELLPMPPPREYPLSIRGKTEKCIVMASALSLQ